MRTTKRVVKKKSEIEPVIPEKIGSREHAVNDHIITGISRRLNIPRETVEEVIRSQWKFLHHIMTDDKLYSFRIKFLGIFGIKNWRFKYSKWHKNYHVRPDEIIRGVDPILLKKIKDRQDELQNP